MDAAGVATYNPQTVEEVFRDYKGRRNGMIKTLTTDVEDFFWQCDPEEVPPELPEPALGINFARDRMQETDWLALVGVHSDAWLLFVAFYFGASFGFDKSDRKCLFNMTNDLPTIFEVVSGNTKKQTKISNHNNKWMCSSEKVERMVAEAEKYANEEKENKEVIDIIKRIITYGAHIQI